MKRQVILLMLVLFVLVGCSYFTDTEYEMEHFDKVSCISVDNGLYTAKVIKALTDPYFLDDKNVDAYMTNAESIIG
jgi:hypothetical protein